MLGLVEAELFLHLLEEYSVDVPCVVELLYVGLKPFLKNVVCLVHGVLHHPPYRP